MLKALKINYKLTQISKQNKLTVKTFRALCQRFGHINLIGEDPFLDADVFSEVITISKYLNTKLSVSVDIENVFDLIQHNLKDVSYYFEQIDVLSLNVNAKIDLTKAERIIGLAREFNCTVTLNTTLTNENVVLDLVSSVDHLLFEEWTIYKSHLSIKQEQIDQFIKNNDCERLNHVVPDYYVMPRGNIYHVNKRKPISTINQNSKLIHKDLLEHSAYFKQQLEQLKPLDFNFDQRFLEKSIKQIKTGRAAFFDIEAVSRKSTNAAKHQIKDYPVPILYALLKIDKNISQVVDRESFTATSPDNLNSVYHAFFKYIKRNKIAYLVVSNGDLEKRFLENCLFYLKDTLRIEDVRLLVKLRDQMIDIQKVLERPYNSFQLLMTLSTLVPDLVTFRRKQDKLSIKINFILDGLIFGPKYHEKGLNKIISYCYEDVYADFELYKLYLYINKNKLT